jgi:hypothetical protein
LLKDLPSSNALARRPDSTLRRRLSAIRFDGGRGAHLTPTPCPSARLSRAPPPLNQGFLDTNASRIPHGYRNQHNVRILLRAGGKTHQDRTTRQTPHRASYSKPSLATGQRLLVTHMQSTIPFLCNSGGQILPQRTSLRRWREVWRPRPVDPRATTRLVVVDRGSESVQRKAHSQSRRDRVPTYEQLRLCMGRCSKQTPRSARILEQRGRTSTHYLEGDEGRPSCCREFLTTADRPRRPPATTK